MLVNRSVYKVTCIPMPPTSINLKHHEDAGKWVTGWMGVLKLSPEKNVQTNGVVKDAFRTHVGRGSFSKNELVRTAASAWEHVTRLSALVNVLLEENRQLLYKVVDSDASLIALQTELIASKDAQLKAVTSAVETVVQESVEKSWSQVAAISANRQPAGGATVISSAVIQRAVKDFTEGEERSRNLIVFGLQEEEGEVVGERVSELFGKLGEKPRPEEVLRLGKKSTGQHRPVIVKLRTATAAAGILKKSQGLRNSEKFRSVFISPDRTIAQRAEHRRLVSLVKRQAEEDKSRRFFISDGEVQSVKRVSGAGGRDSSSGESSGEEESEESEYSVDIRD